MKHKRISNEKKSIMCDVFAVIIACVFLFPIYWIIVNSFKLDSEIFLKTPTIWPQQFTLTAYQAVIGDLLSTLKNSVVIAVGSMAISMVLSVPAAYGLAKFQIKGKQLFMLLFLITQMLPASLVLTPLFLTFSNLGLLNTYLAPILSTATISIPFIVLMLRPGFLAIPDSLTEAARIDGCGTFRAFLQVALPVSKPTVITAFCFSFVFAWNDLAYSMTFNTRETMRPMTSAIYTFMNQFGTKWNSIMAFGVLLITPCVVIFVTMQKHIVAGMTSGSVKG